ncbi:MAG: hypothetical protein LC745_02950 [Planctomycetia bacterium]|nr:hypothetical protein [Planctomycetia bacterium]
MMDQDLPEDETGVNAEATEPVIPTEAIAAAEASVDLSAEFPRTEGGPTDLDLVGQPPEDGPTDPGVIPFEPGEAAHGHRVENALHRLGEMLIERLDRMENQFRRETRAEAAREKDDPALNKTVAARHRKGFQAGERVIRPEVVSVYALRT